MAHIKLVHKKDKTKIEIPEEHFTDAHKAAGWEIEPEETVETIEEAVPETNSRSRSRRRRAAAQETAETSETSEGSENA